MVTGCAISAVSDFYCSRYGLLIIQGEYLIRIAHAADRKPVVLGVMEVSEKRGEKEHEEKDNYRVDGCVCQCSSRDSDLSVC
jgi:hypothetical protein